jgi:hypothetical protein
MLRDIVKVRFIATNCGEHRLDLVRSTQSAPERDDRYSENNSIPLLPGESSEFSSFRSWDIPGEHQLTLAYEVQRDGLPFARLTYPAVAIHVNSPELNKLVHWLWWARPAHR